MADNTRYMTIGDFVYDCEYDGYDDPENWAQAVEYVGAEGPGSVATVPYEIEVDGKMRTTSGRFWKLLQNKQIEKIVTYATTSFEDLPALKEIECHVVPGMEHFVCHSGLKRAPALQTYTVVGALPRPVELPDEHRSVKRVYLGGITDLDEEVAGDGIHAIFGHEVEKVGTIRSGHVTLGKGVNQVKALKKGELGQGVDITVAEYELPTRIDFLSPTPPVVGTAAPATLAQIEIHVPSGALDAYLAHPKWGKAGYIVEEGGRTIDNYAPRHEARMKQLREEREAATAKATAEAKKEKLEAMGAMLHPAMAAKRLAPWNPQVDDRKGFLDYIYVTVTVKSLKFTLKIEKSAPVTIYDQLVARLTRYESQLP